MLMSFDGVFTHAMVEELNQKLNKGRISKIHQPYDYEIIVTIRANGKNHKLLLSAHPNYARIQLTTISYINPENPPNFVMVLRKFLEGAILEMIHQVANDRIIHFTFSKRNELGDLQSIVLVVELMGRHSTIVLMNKETGKIIDAIKHIGPSQNTYRTILPGISYIAPPKQNLVNLFTLVDDEQIFEQLSLADPLNSQYLQQHFQGLGKDTANELAFRLNEKPNQKLMVWKTFWNEVQKITPTLSVINQKDYFSSFPFIKNVETVQHFTTLSQLLDVYYENKAEKDRTKQQGNDLIHKIENEYKKNQKKLSKLKTTLAETENAEIYRRKGELLTTFMQQIPRGAKSVLLPNYYEEDKLLDITLNPALSPNQNAQKYFQKFQKLKNAVKIVQNQIQQTLEEIAYLESVLAQLEIAQPSDIEIIREELLEQGYVKKKQNKKRKKTQISRPEEFISSDGTPIFVGKNNLQNDQLTLKTAKKTDIWLHAKDIPGSHVIIRSHNPSEKTLLEAANLAAYYSKYRLSARVPVDYVEVKFVHKPNGAKPGYVIYENQQTLYVTLEKELVYQLKR